MSRDKRLPWRCANKKQAMDKATIYNSREWQELRIAKLRSQPLCERCLSQGRYVRAHPVHHIIPIETAHNMADMKRLAFDFKPSDSEPTTDRSDGKRKSWRVSHPR